VERLCRLRELEDGYLLCRKGAICTRLYFLLNGQVTSSGGEEVGTSIKTKNAGTFLPDAEFFANMAIRFDDLHKKVMLPTTIREDWRCDMRMQVLEIKFQPFLALVCKSQSLYENLYNIATAHYSVRGIRHSFRPPKSTVTTGSSLGAAVSNIQGNEEPLSFDQLTEKQKLRLKNAGLLEQDIIENTELVVQILRANEGMDLEALRTFQLFRKLDKITLTRIANQLRPVHFKAGQYVLRVGEPGESMYFINSGRVAAVVGGKELPAMKRGQFFGEIAIVQVSKGSVRTADVVCLENCDLLELTKDTILSIVHDAPKLYAALQAQAQERLEADQQKSSTAGALKGYDPKNRDDAGGYDDFPDDTAPFLRHRSGGTSRDSSASPHVFTRTPSVPPSEQKLSLERELARKNIPPLTPGQYPTARQFANVTQVAANIKYDVDPKKSWDTLHKLAKGSSGTVYLGQPKDPVMLEKYPQVAIKKFNISEETEIKELENEIELMSVSNHPNIVDYIESYQWGGKSRDSSTKVWVIMEAMMYGALNGLLEKFYRAWYSQDHRQLESCIAYVQRECLKGLAYLHTFLRVHRDIKSDNILIGHGGCVKVADLGFTVQLTQEAPSRSSVLGTPYWMAPEVIREKPYASKIDIWSLGIVLRECTQKDPPYFTETVFRAMYLISTSGVPAIGKKKDGSSWSKELINYDKMCLKFDSRERHSCEEALQHPFIAKACEATIFEQVILRCKTSDRKMSK
jgi:CRP-like cAMP-binding protein